MLEMHLFVHRKKSLYFCNKNKADKFSSRKSDTRKCKQKFFPDELTKIRILKVLEVKHVQRCFSLVATVSFPFYPTNEMWIQSQRINFALLLSLQYHSKSEMFPCYYLNSSLPLNETKGNSLNG